MYRQTRLGLVQARAARFADTAAGLVFGKVLPDAPLELVSHMPGNGVIFSDGMEADFLEFTSGTRAAIAPAEKKGHLVI